MRRRKVTFRPSEGVDRIEALGEEVKRVAVHLESGKRIVKYIWPKCKCKSGSYYNL